MAAEPEPALDALPFLVADQSDDDQDSMGLFDGERVVRLSQIPVTVLRENLRATMATLRSVLDEAASGAGRLRLREVQVGLEVSATGGINLIGTAAVGATGAITLTFAE